MRLLPFSRKAVSSDDYARIASDALASVLPMADLLRRRGIALGSVEQGRAHAVELEVVTDHVDALSMVERSLSRVRPPDDLASVHAALRAFLESYRAALFQYQGVCGAVRDADVRAYRAHNQRGRELDARACGQLRTLVEITEAPSAVQVPESLQRIAARAQAYQRVAGGAFAFWE